MGGGFGFLEYVLDGWYCAADEEEEEEEDACMALVVVEETLLRVSAGGPDENCTLLQPLLQHVRSIDQ